MNRYRYLFEKYESIQELVDHCWKGDWYEDFDMKRLLEKYGDQQDKLDELLENALTCIKFGSCSCDVQELEKPKLINFVAYLVNELEVQQCNDILTELRKELKDQVELNTDKFTNIVIEQLCKKHKILLNEIKQFSVKMLLEYTHENKTRLESTIYFDQLQQLLKKVENTIKVGNAI